MHQPDENLTAVDVIRCVYLARAAEQRGDLASARRWQAKADAWLRETSWPANLLQDGETPPNLNTPTRGP